MKVGVWTSAGGEGWRAQPLEGCKTDLILKVAVVSKWMAGSDWLDASWVVQEFSFFMQRTFCKNSTNNCQSVERSILGNLWRSIQARYGCEKLFHTPALTKSDVAPALRIWIEVGEALNWRGCRMSRNAWGSPPMWTTHQSLTENCELLFSSGMRNPCVTFAGPLTFCFGRS